MTINNRHCFMDRKWRDKIKRKRNLKEKKTRSKRKDKRMVITRSEARRRQCCAFQEGKM